MEVSIINTYKNTKEYAFISGGINSKEYIEINTLKNSKEYATIKCDGITYTNELDAGVDFAL